MKILKCALLGLSAGTFGAAMASQALFVNKSPTPITVVYKVAHKNPGQPVGYGQTQTIKLAGNQTVAIPFSMNGYKQAGIVPMSINDTKLPESVTQGAIPEKCLTSDALNSGNLTLTFKDGHPKTLSCSVQE